MNTTALWNFLHLRSDVPKINYVRDVMLCSPADIYQRFKEPAASIFMVEEQVTFLLSWQRQQVPLKCWYIPTFKSTETAKSLRCFD
jgi:hypothetical protein